jgi:hypothetical protein
MSRADFTIAYDGEALKDHRIDVRDLAPALLAVGQLFEAANRELNREQTETKVLVKATAAGSFQVVIEVVQTYARQVVGLLTGDHVEAAVRLKELLFGEGGLITLLLLIRGRKPKEIAKSSAGITLEINGQTVVISQQVIQLAESVPVRTEVLNLLAPLRREGIDTFAAKESPGATPMTTIKKSDLRAFDVPVSEEASEALPERSWTQAYSIVSLTFKEDNKWKLSDGQSQIAATISDQDFLAKVDARAISFTKGDILICDVSSRQTHTQDGVRTEYEVTKVVEHRPAPRQVRLF